MRVGSLFSGIGGLDLGLERAGMTVVWQSEIDPYASRVLAKHWPTVPNLGDITTIDWSTVEPVDLICGGYPCQPFSLAGARAGDTDARHLWPYFADALRELRPRFALLENVPGHLSMGFGDVLGDLADLGFDADWECVPAAAVGAPHLRYRVFVVAHADEVGWSGRAGFVGSRRRSESPVCGGDVPDAERVQLRQQPISVGRGSVAAVVGDDGTNGQLASDAEYERRSLGWRFDSRYGRLARNTGWAVEPDVGRVAHGVPSRVDRLKCLGNAVVPQVAEFVGRRIMEAVA